MKVIGAAIEGGTERNRSERRSQSVRGDDDSNPMGQALLHAAEEGKIEAIRRLLDAGADPNGAIHGDGSPLIAASKEGHIEAVTLLLDRGADPDLVVSGDGSPLIAAADEGHIEVVRLLLDRGADPNVGISGDGSPLIAAAGEGYLEIVNLLLEHGATIDEGVVGDGSPSSSRPAADIARSSTCCSPRADIERSCREMRTRHSCIRERQPKWPGPDARRANVNARS